MRRLSLGARNAARKQSARKSQGIARARLSEMIEEATVDAYGESGSERIEAYRHWVGRR